MRSILQKELIACFKTEIGLRLPQFSGTNSEDGFLIWQWKQSTYLTFFVVLQPFAGRDQFTVEIAWSESGEFPWKHFNRMKIEEPQGRRRLPRLWATGSHELVWDLAPEKTASVQADLEALGRGERQAYAPDPPVEQILPRICPMARDAVEKFMQYGIPLFQRVAEHRGLVWPKQSTLVS